MKKLLLTMLLLLAAVALIAQGAFELGDKTPYTITPKAAQQQSTGQLEGITEPYEFEIGKCQAMFAESQYKKYMSAFKAKHAKRSIIKGVFGETTIKNHNT